MAESFLFLVAASLIIAETWRSSNKESKRREGVTDQLEELTSRVHDLADDLTRTSVHFDEKWCGEKSRYIFQAIYQSGVFTMATQG